MDTFNFIRRLFNSGESEYIKYSDLLRDILHSARNHGNKYVPDEIIDFLGNSRYNELGIKIDVDNSIFDLYGFRYLDDPIIGIIDSEINIDVNDNIYQELSKRKLSLDQFSLGYFIHKKYLNVSKDDKFKVDKKMYRFAKLIKSKSANVRVGGELEYIRMY